MNIRDGRSPSRKSKSQQQLKITITIPKEEEEEEEETITYVLLDEGGAEGKGVTGKKKVMSKQASIFMTQDERKQTSISVFMTQDEGSSSVIMEGVVLLPSVVRQVDSICDPMMTSPSPQLNEVVLL